jgi:hypothetical protein
MANQISTIGFSNDASVTNGYAFRTNEKFGNVNFGFENTGNNSVVLQLRELVGSGSLASYSVNLTPQFTLVAGGTTNKALVILNQQIGLFGSGLTTVNVAIEMRNMADRRNPQIEVVPLGKQFWTTSPGLMVNAYSGGYGPTPLF